MFLASNTCAIIMYHAEHEQQDSSLSWSKFNFCLSAIHAYVGFKKSGSSFPGTRTNNTINANSLAEMVEGSLKDRLIPW